MADPRVPDEVVEALRAWAMRLWEDGWLDGRGDVSPDAVTHPTAQEVRAVVEAALHPVHLPRYTGDDHE